MSARKPAATGSSARLADLAKALRHASHAHHTAKPENKVEAEVQLYAVAIQYGDEFRRLERLARRGK